MSADSPVEVSDAPLAAGVRVGDYVIEAPIGSGMFGTVYAARHPVIRTPVAIKVLAWRYSADAAMVARFIDEARAASRIDHPGIVRVFGFGRLPDGRRYHIMERLFGEGLDALLARVGRLDLDAALALLTPIAGAISAAHAAGVIHRDVKPANVFVCAEGPPKLLDFGVAKLVDDAAHAQQTATGVAVGTPAYMAPEQCLGEAMGPTVDVYALGVLTYAVLAGRLPFEHASGFAMMTAHINTPPPALHRAVPTLPKAASRVVQAMMAKAPAERPADATAAIEALAEALHGAPPRRGRGGLLVGVGLIGVGLLGWLALQPGEEVTALDAAPPPVDAAVDARPLDAVDAQGADARVVDAAQPETVMIEVHGLPAGAQATFEGVAQPLSGSPAILRLPRDATPARVRFAAPGHRSVTASIDRRSDGKTTVRLRAPAPAAPASRHLHGIDPY